LPALPCSIPWINLISVIILWISPSFKDIDMNSHLKFLHE
jgi:hypothetical protein